MTGADALSAASRLAIRQGSKSFHAASRLLPRDSREDAALLYAWCRYCDDVVDGQTLGGAIATGAGESAARRLDNLTELTRAALHTEEEVPLPFQALRQVARRHAFPEAWPLDLLAGFRMDVEGTNFQTLGDTLRYSYHVAGVVGVMMARVLGVRDEGVLDRASDLGIAFQLTNIARDVIEDARAGRSYLPALWLEEAGGDIRIPVDPDSTAEWAPAHQAALRLLDAAEPYYESALFGLRSLPPRAAWAIAAARRIYRDIGARVAEGGPEAWRGRVATSRARKAVLLLAALKDVGLDGQTEAPPRDGLWTRPREAA